MTAANAPSFGTRRSLDVRPEELQRDGSSFPALHASMDTIQLRVYGCGLARAAGRSVIADWTNFIRV